MKLPRPLATIVCVALAALAASVRAEPVEVVVYQNGFESADTCAWSATLPAATCDPQMVYVPEGPFTMGGDEVGSSGLPTHQVTLSAFWIDRTEVTVDAYEACVADGPCTPPNELGLPEVCNSDSDRPGTHPVNCVDWSQGETYCSWVGKRYPTEAEWEKAARGPAHPTYPWGEATPTCDYAVFFDLPIGKAGCGANSTLPVGSRPAGASIYGALDMIGNVWEWVHDWYDASYYTVSPSADPQGPASSPIGYRSMRGDSWEDSHSTFLRAPYRGFWDPTAQYYPIGFRCARDG